MAPACRWKDPAAAAATDARRLLAARNTLNRLEFTPSATNDTSPCRKILPDVDATDNPLHSHQPGRFVHADYQNYAYLPLYLLFSDHRGAHLPSSPTVSLCVRLLRWQSYGHRNMKVRSDPETRSIRRQGIRFSRRISAEIGIDCYWQDRIVKELCDGSVFCPAPFSHIILAAGHKPSGYA